MTEITATNPKAYWVWRDGPGGYWIYDHEFPRYAYGDPKTLGEPVFTGTLLAVMHFIAGELK
jgi:hypothetical protein